MRLFDLFAGGEIKKQKKAVQNNPDDPEAHFRLATAYEEKNNTEAAIRHFQETLRLQPRSAEAHFNLGILFESKGDGENAIVHMNRAGTLFSERADGVNKERARKRLRDYYDKYGFRGKEDPE